MGWLALLVLSALSASLLDHWANPPKIIEPRGQSIHVADGDSFTSGTEKLRLDGIDAPEYRQTCKDSTGGTWDCGKAARAALDRIVRQPGLTCAAKTTDQYGRLVARCSNIAETDIGSAQVLAGMAVSHEDYGEEENKARTARRGIWVGEFISPAEWRKSNSNVAAPKPST